jgi:flagellar basal-body rod protein FlgG
MYAQQLNVDTLAHNMSNVNTTAYKVQRTEFQDLLYQTIRRPTANEDTLEPVGLQVGLGVRPVAINTLYNQGNLIATEQPLDVAINGPGFFQVEVPGYEEPLYTRNGALKLDAEGSLVTSDGYYLVGVDPLEEGAYDITITSTGIVNYYLPGETEPQEAGQLLLSKFTNPAGLNHLGKSLYAPSINSGDPIDWDPDDDSTIEVIGGYLEASNVQVVEEMVNLITAQRAYEFNSKLIQASDEMLQTAAGLKR